MYDLIDQASDDEMGAEMGDPRRCPHHPGVQTSSPDGMFDAPCGACEAESDASWQEMVQASYEFSNPIETAMQVVRWMASQAAIEARRREMESAMASDDIPF
jgi:hypothetical protein